MFAFIIPFNNEPIIKHQIVEKDLKTPLYCII
jgi:hypothetical protein